MVGATIVEFCKRLLDGDRLILRILYIRVAFTSERLVSRFSISNYHLQAQSTDLMSCDMINPLITFFKRLPASYTLEL